MVEEEQRMINAWLSLKVVSCLKRSLLE